MIKPFELNLALSEVMSYSATHELSTVAFGTERKRVLRITAYCLPRPN